MPKQPSLEKQGTFIVRLGASSPSIDASATCSALDVSSLSGLSSTQLQLQGQQPSERDPLAWKREPIRLRYPAAGAPSGANCEHYRTPQPLFIDHLRTCPSQHRSDRLPPMIPRLPISLVASKMASGFLITRSHMDSGTWRIPIYSLRTFVSSLPRLDS